MHFDNSTLASLVAAHKLGEKLDFWTEQHLLTCPECRTRYDELRQLSEMELDDKLLPVANTPTFDLSFLQPWYKRPWTWLIIGVVLALVIAALSFVALLVPPEWLNFLLHGGR